MSETRKKQHNATQQSKTSTQLKNYLKKTDLQAYQSNMSI